MFKFVGEALEVVVDDVADDAPGVGAVAYELTLGHGASTLMGADVVGFAAATALVGADVLGVGTAFVVGGGVGDLAGEADTVAYDAASYGAAEGAGDEQQAAFAFVAIWYFSGITSVKS